VTQHDDAEPAPETKPGGWVVWRQGDDGNPFEVARLDSRPEAEELVGTMEARAHRQTYWVASTA
jgi:hypothetical protein